jgi:hypothetical protein
MILLNKLEIRSLKDKIVKILRDSNHPSGANQAASGLLAGNATLGTAPSNLDIGAGLQRVNSKNNNGSSGVLTSNAILLARGGSSSNI